MRVVKCENGHFFDLEKGTVCPRCGSDEYTLTGVKETPVVIDKKALKAQAKLKKTEEKLKEKEFKQKIKTMKKGGYYAEPQSVSPIINSMTGEEFKYNMGPTGDFVDYRNDTRRDVSVQPEDTKTEKLESVGQDTRTEQFESVGQDTRTEQLGGFNQNIGVVYPEHLDSDTRTEQLVDNVPPVAKTVVNNMPAPKVDLSDEKTVYYEDFEVQDDVTPVDAVVGWLVCVEGEDRGTHYTLKAGVNNLGRSVDMDVSIRNDIGISRDRHSILTYEPKNREFFIEPGIGRGITYLNENMVLGSTKINERDCIRMGKTKLVFVSLCSQEFGWE